MASYGLVAMYRVRHLMILSMLLLNACSDKPNVSEKSVIVETTLPKKPTVKPCYLNTSSLQTINDVAIGDLMRAEKYTGIDYSMAILDRLPKGYTAETAAVELFSQWEIGQQHQGRGVLYLFIEADGVLKIEVGYELEDVFPDGFVGSFQETLKDYYRGEYFGDVVSSMIITMMRRAQGEEVQPLMEQFKGGLLKKRMIKPDYLSGGAGVTESNFVKSRTDRLQNVTLLSDTERKNYAKDADVEIVLKRYLNSLKKGINDPYLPLLTKGSQFMRLEYPKNSGFQKNAYQKFSGSYKIYKSGDYAAVRFDRPDVMPILFRKDSEGNWLADITKSWAYSQATRDLKQMKPAYGDHFWIFAWEKELKEAEIPETPRPFPKEKSLEQEIARIENAIKESPEIASNYFQLADIFYYECYWIRDAMNLIEMGLKYEPENCLYRKKYIQFAYRFPDLSKVHDQFEAIYKHDPGDYKNLGAYCSYLNWKKPPGYKSKLEELEKIKERKPLPKSPFPITAGSGKARRMSFYFSNSTRNLEANYNFFTDQWHETYRPATKIYLYDDESEVKFGVMLMQKTPDGPITIEPLADDKHRFITLIIPNNEAINLKFNWMKSNWPLKNEFQLSIDGRKILSMESYMNPSRIITYQQSGSSIITLTRRSRNQHRTLNFQH